MSITIFGRDETEERRSAIYQIINIPELSSGGITCYLAQWSWLYQ